MSRKNQETTGPNVDIPDTTEFKYVISVLHH